MQILYRLAELIHYELLVCVLKDPCLDHAMQVLLHVVEYQVDIEVVRCLHDVLQPDYVRMVELRQEHHFAVSPLTVSFVLKRLENFLKCDLLASFFVLRLPHNPICTLTYLLDDIIAFEHVFFYISVVHL